MVNSKLGNGKLGNGNPSNGSVRRRTTLARFPPELWNDHRCKKCFLCFLLKPCFFMFFYSGMFFTLKFYIIIRRMWNCIT